MRAAILALALAACSSSPSVDRLAVHVSPQFSPARREVVRDAVRVWNAAAGCNAFLLAWPDRANVFVMPAYGSLEDRDGNALMGSAEFVDGVWAVQLLILDWWPPDYLDRWVVLHELGHVLGLEHGAGGVMDIGRPADGPSEAEGIAAAAWCGRPLGDS